MTIQQSVRAAERLARQQYQAAVRHQRYVAQQFREAQKRQAAAVKHFEKEAAAHDVAAFEAYLASLVSIHREGLTPVDWTAVARSRPPAAPQPTRAREISARAALDQYAPGWIDRTFGGAKRRVSQLEEDLQRALEQDAQDFHAAHQQYLQAHAAWEKNRRDAERVLAGDPAAYGGVLAAWNPPSVLEPYSISARLVSVDGNVAEYGGSADFDASVPTEEIKLTKAGNLSRKQMAVGKRWDLCQDLLCSATLRLAVDTFALVPVSRVIINLGGRSLNSATGHWEETCWLAAHITRRDLFGINLHGIDPSDSMANFQVRMKFRKTKGFAPVDPITRDDQWVTT